jgi:hypothetical protein
MPETHSVNEFSFHIEVTAEAVLESRRDGWSSPVALAILAQALPAPLVYVARRDAYIFAVGAAPGTPRRWRASLPADVADAVAAHRHAGVWAGPRSFRLTFKTF